MTEIATVASPASTSWGLGCEVLAQELAQDLVLAEVLAQELGILVGASSSRESATVASPASTSCRTKQDTSDRDVSFRGTEQVCVPGRHATRRPGPVHSRNILNTEIVTVASPASTS